MAPPGRLRTPLALESVIAQVNPRPAFTVKAKRYCLTMRLLLSESPGQVLWAFGFAGLGGLGDRPPPSEGGDLPQRAVAHGRRPAYHGTSQTTGGSRWQRISLISAVYGRRR